MEIVRKVLLSEKEGEAVRNFLRLKGYSIRGWCSFLREDDKKDFTTLTEMCTGKRYITPKTYDHFLKPLFNYDFDTFIKNVGRIK